MSSLLAALCTVSNIAQLVLQFSALSTVTYHNSSITATVISNYTNTPSANGAFYPTASGAVCNVTLSLNHINLDDNVQQQFWLPDLPLFQNRYLSNGGGGWSVSGANSLGSGLSYGAVSGATDGGFGGFNSGLTAEILASGGNGTVQWSSLESFAYQAIHEMTVTGKELTKAFYNITDDELKSYYLGCSEGGREGHMSTQRFPEDFDGVAAGAPAMYFPVHQLAQGWPNIAMAQLNHWPSPCAFVAIEKEYIAACDPLDGLTDGVISRSDLCKYNATASVGKTWSNCTSGGSGAPTSGTVNELDAEVVNLIYRGGLDSSGNLFFWPYQPGTTLTVEAGVKYNSTTGTFGPGTNNFFGTYYQNLVLRSTVAPTIDYSDFTVDDVYQLMLQGIQDYGSWTETTWPDLSDFQANGGKLIHFHGEQDTNLFPQASAHFYEKVRAAMFPDDAGYDSIQEFYQFYRIPGAAHCGINSYQPNGPFPQYVLQQLIDWVEYGIAPEYLNGSTETGTSTQPKICMWPTVPQWSESGTFSCAESNDTASLFIRPLDGWKVGDLL
ncbi:hypothetical protein LQW54_004336 [Pestalotiopsis sp. IQ-011]